LLMPRIDSIPEETHYQDHMKGDVSWKNSFEVEGGRINLYKAFVRGTRNKLLSEATNEKPWLLKSWRDQIILDMAGKNEIEKAGRYTRFIDEIVPGGKKNQNAALMPGDIRERWMANVERFIDGLRGLKAANQFTQENVLNLLKPAVVAEPPLALALVPEGGRLRSDFRQTLPSAEAPVSQDTRSEVRMSLSPSEAVNQAFIDLEKSLEDGGGGVREKDIDRIVELSKRAETAQVFTDEHIAKLVALINFHQNSNSAISALESLSTRLSPQAMSSISRGTIDQVLNFVQPDASDSEDLLQVSNPDPESAAPVPAGNEELGDTFNEFMREDLEDSYRTALAWLFRAMVSNPANRDKFNETDAYLILKAFLRGDDVGVQLGALAKSSARELLVKIKFSQTGKASLPAFDSIIFALDQLDPEVLVKTARSETATEEDRIKLRKRLDRAAHLIEGLTDLLEVPEIAARINSYHLQEISKWFLLTPGLKKWDAKVMRDLLRVPPSSYSAAGDMHPGQALETKLERFHTRLREVILEKAEDHRSQSLEIINGMLRFYAGYLKPVSEGENDYTTWGPNQTPPVHEGGLPSDQIAATIGLIMDGLGYRNPQPFSPGSRLRPALIKMKNQIPLNDADLDAANESLAPINMTITLQDGIPQLRAETRTETGAAGEAASAEQLADFLSSLLEGPGFEFDESVYEALAGNAGRVSGQRWGVIHPEPDQIIKALEILANPEGHQEPKLQGQLGNIRQNKQFYPWVIANHLQDKLNNYPGSEGAKSDSARTAINAVLAEKKLSELDKQDHRVTRYIAAIILILRVLENGGSPADAQIQKSVVELLMPDPFTVPKIPRDDLRYFLEAGKFYQERKRDTAQKIETPYYRAREAVAAALKASKKAKEQGLVKKYDDAENTFSAFNQVADPEIKKLLDKIANPSAPARSETRLPVDRTGSKLGTPQPARAEVRVNEDEDRLRMRDFLIEDILNKLRSDPLVSSISLAYKLENVWARSAQGPFHFGSLIAKITGEPEESSLWLTVAYRLGKNQSFRFRPSQTIPTEFLEDPEFLQSVEEAVMEQLRLSSEKTPMAGLLRQLKQNIETFLKYYPKQGFLREDFFEPLESDLAGLDSAAPEDLIIQTIERYRSRWKQLSIEIDLMAISNAKKRKGWFSSFSFGGNSEAMQIKFGNEILNIVSQILPARSEVRATELIAKGFERLIGEIERQSAVLKGLNQRQRQQQLFAMLQTILTEQMKVDLAVQRPQEVNAISPRTEYLEIQEELQREIRDRLDAARPLLAKATAQAAAPDLLESLFGEYVPSEDEVVLSGELITENGETSLEILPAGEALEFLSQNRFPAGQRVLQFEIYARGGELHMEVVDLIGAPNTGNTLRFYFSFAEWAQFVSDYLKQPLTVEFETAVFGGKPSRFGF
ncbi:MAG: hypothetical protein HYZ83_00280, partial [Candidatus Omnitrophica bacterium]|nr:hypothetical protein [Candidatus Omnitrophota bacterium]